MAIGVVSIPLSGRIGEPESRHVRSSARRGSPQVAAENRLGCGVSPAALADAYLVGSENRLLGAVLSFVMGAERGAEKTSPSADWYRLLVLHGPTGCGKSHLARGLAGWWVKQHPRDKIVCLHGSEFAQDYAAAVDASEEIRWRDEHRAARLFVLDDVGQLAAKGAAQRELSATLDALADQQAMVVITAPETPSRLDGLSASLRSRLAGGLLAPIASAGPAVRLALVERFAEVRGWSIEHRWLRQLAELTGATTPELFGALLEIDFRLMTATGAAAAESPRIASPWVGSATSEAASIPDDRQTVSTAIDAVDANAAVAQWLADHAAQPSPSIRAIAAAVGRHFGFTLAELKSPLRRQSLVAARNAAMHLVRELTGTSLLEIGRYFGGRDHTTVLHGCRQAERAAQRDTSHRQAIEELARSLLNARSSPR